MKRSLLIAGGTIGGLGAVMAITPPQLGGNSSLSISGDVSGSGTSTLASASSSSAATAVAATKAAKPVATKKSTTASKTTAVASKATTAAKASASATPTATKTAAAATAAATTAAATTGGTKSINGSFTGPSVFVQYGNVQVKITVVNGRITDAVAIQNPGQGRNARYTNMALPVLKAQTLAAQSANIQGVSGASYTAYGWYKSLQGALATAGL